MVKRVPPPPPHSFPYDVVYSAARPAEASPTVKKQEVGAPLPVYDAAQDGNVFEWILRAASSRRQAGGVMHRLGAGRPRGGR